MIAFVKLYHYDFPATKVHVITSHYQGQPNRECLLPQKHRPEKCFRQARLGAVDLDNKALRDVVKQLEQSFTSLLDRSAQKAGKLQSIPAERLHLQFKCAHDAVKDPLTDDIFVPHFIADCTILCKTLADAAIKHRLGDASQEPYEVTVANARNDVKKVQARVKKAQKLITKTQKKVDVTAKKLNGASEKTKSKMQKAHDKAINAYANAQRSFQEVTVALQQAEKVASDAESKHVKVLQVQKDIILCWQRVVGTLTSGKSSACPNCVDNCHLFLPMCPKCELQQCQCK